MFLPSRLDSEGAVLVGDAAFVRWNRVRLRRRIHIHIRHSPACGLDQSVDGVGNDFDLSSLQCPSQRFGVASVRHLEGADPVSGSRWASFRPLIIVPFAGIAPHDERSRRNQHHPIRLGGQDEHLPQ